MEDNHPSIVEYYSQQEKGHCGYCTSNIGSRTYGLHAHILKVEDYQNMIDRGWRRSGKYCYKAIMKKSCCPLYTIKCAATNFKVSKTQKKVIKKFNNFLATGKVVKDKMPSKIDVVQFLDTNMYNSKEDVKEVLNDDLKMSFSSSSIPALIEQNHIPPNSSQKEEEDKKPIENIEVKNKVTIGKSSKNKCLKAKYIRIERKKQKLKQAGFNEEEIAKKLVEKKKYPIVKKLEDHLSQPLSKNQIHNLRIALVRSCPRSEEFNNTFEVAFDLYKRYQMFVHKDTLDKLTERQYERFLVISPLQASGIYGSYHQQYWLDDKLIAVGVIDILPKCVSSVYFFYDPDYAHLSLGTYGALREVEFTRNLASRYPDLQFYYMGFYIHSCIKMKYKAAFSPSFLLCPEVYTWHPIKDCLPKLNSAKYSRFNDSVTAEDENAKVAPSQILILYKRTIMPLEYYMQQKKGDPEEIEEIMEYAMLVGRKCSSSMLLFRI